MSTESDLELAARKAAVAACSFVAAEEPELATHVLSFYLYECESAGHSRLIAMSALVGQLISVVCATAQPGTLAAMSLQLGVVQT